MEYLVTVTTNVPEGTSQEAIADMRGREAAHSRELAAQLSPHPNDPALASAQNAT